MVTTSTLKDHDLNSIAQLMEIKGANDGFLGAAVVGIYQILQSVDSNITHVAGINSGEYTSRLSRQPEPENPKRGKDDKGTDYLAMAHAKKSKRLRLELGQDIGEPSERRGEDKATGDEAMWLAKDIIAIAAFSGAPEMEQDRQVAEYGMALLLSYAINPKDFEGYSQWFQNHPNTSNTGHTPSPITA